MIPAEVGTSVVGAVGVLGVVIVMAIAALAKRRMRLTRELESRLSEIGEAVESMTTVSRDREALLDARLTRLELMIETLAVETERIGEGQRHVSKLLVGREAQDENDKRR